MKLAVHQPHYMPGPGYFHTMASADLFVFLNDVQFEKNEWQNRNRIRNAKSWQWLSVPTTYKFPQKLNEVQERDQDSARRKHVEGQAIQAGVGPQGVVDAAAVAGELGRVEHDAVEPLAGRLQRMQGLEGIAAFEADVAQAVALGVDPGLGHRPLAGIERPAPRGPCPGRLPQG